MKVHEVFPTVVAQDRIDVARQQQMAKTAENMAKNFFGGR